MREAGLRSATELEVELSPREEFHAQSVHSYMPRQKGEKELAMASNCHQKNDIYVHPLDEVPDDPPPPWYCVTHVGRHTLNEKVKVCVIWQAYLETKPTTV